MPKLQDLQPLIDAGEIGVLSLRADQPENPVKENVKIIISRVSNNVYKRRDSYIDKPTKYLPGGTIDSWKAVLEDLGELATSDQWQSVSQ